MERAELIAAAREKATQHGLWPELVCAICEQESNWNPWAIRYEPTFLSKYIAPLYTAGKISGTEAYARAFSWGLMQVMGQTAREHGFADAYLSGLCEPIVGLEIGCKVLTHKLAVNEGNVRRALLAWNGGGNPKYPDEVLARVSTYEHLMA